MKRKIYYSLFFTIVTVGFLFFSALTNADNYKHPDNGLFWAKQEFSIMELCPTNHIAFTTIAPNIDGVADVCWTGAEIGTFTHATIGTIQPDFAGSRWRALYDNTFLYLIAEIKDNSLNNDGGPDWYNDDCVEVFIDAKYNRGNEYDHDNDFQLAFRYNDPIVIVGTNSVNNTTGIIFAQHVFTDGYNIEIKIPWTTLNILLPADGQSFGFDIEVDDDDAIGNDYRESQVAAFDISGNAWNNPLVFGKEVFCSGIPDFTIDRAIGQTDSTNNSTINFNVVFSERVIGFVPADVQLSGTAGANLVSLSGTGPEYNLAVSGMTTEGTVIVNINAGVCTDYNGNSNSTPDIIDNTVYFDNSRPGVEITLESSQINPTNASIISFNANFSESVKSFNSTSVQLSGTSGASSVYVRNGPENFIIDVSGMTDPGDVTITIPENVVTDFAGNYNLASTNTQNSVYFDNVKADVDISTTITSPTSLNEIPITIGFSKTVSGFEISDFNISNGTISSLTETIAGTGWEAIIVPASIGIVNIQIPADATIDEAGNGNNASNHFQINYINSSVTFSAVNIITPNSSLNRLWTINNVNIYTDYELIIRNSSGQIVYKTTNYQNDWNGTYKNNTLPTGTYYYFFSSPDKQTIYKGFINIIYE